jgi:hypothetical protein
MYTDAQAPSDASAKTAVKRRNSSLLRLKTTGVILLR